MESPTANIRELGGEIMLRLRVGIVTRTTRFQHLVGRIVSELLILSWLYWLGISESNSPMTRRCR